MPSDETKKVLVAVSDLQTRQRLSGWLQNNGYDPLEIKGAESVGPQICKNAHLVISEVDETGASAGLIRNVRSAEANVPIILVTESGLADRAVGCMQSGATDFLLKPVNSAELSLKVNRALKERQLHEELSAVRAGQFSKPIVGGMANVQPRVQTLQKIEREAILEALDSFDGARGKTAKALGISVRTLQRKIKEYGYSKRAEKTASSFSGVDPAKALHN